MVSIIYILYSYLLNKVGGSILDTIKAQDKYYSFFLAKIIFFGITDLAAHKEECYPNLNAKE